MTALPPWLPPGFRPDLKSCPATKGKCEKGCADICRKQVPA